MHTPPERAIAPRPFGNKRPLQGILLWLIHGNHYDRLVHFSVGRLIAYPFRELRLRAARLRESWSYLLAVTVVLAFSNFYEIIEAMVAEIVSPDLGAAYLGTQGDEWDAQKDAFVAFIGAVLAMTVTWIRVKRIERRAALMPWAASICRRFSRSGGTAGANAIVAAEQQRPTSRRSHSTAHA
jgi:hypothetical protein